MYVLHKYLIPERISLHRSNINLPENRKFYVSKKAYECRNGLFKIMSKYQTDDYILLQIKEKNFVEKIKPSLNRT